MLIEKIKKTGTIKFNENGEVVIARKEKVPGITKDEESSEDDNNAYEGHINELASINKLLEMIDTDEKLADVKENSPGVIKAIKRYSATLERKIDVCEWNPNECEYSCRDMYIFWKVKK